MGKSAVCTNRIDALWPQCCLAFIFGLCTRHHVVHFAFLHDFENVFFSLHISLCARNMFPCFLSDILINKWGKPTATATTAYDNVRRQHITLSIHINTCHSARAGQMHIWDSLAGFDHHKSSVFTWMLAISIFCELTSEPSILYAHSDDKWIF